MTSDTLLTTVCLSVCPIAIKITQKKTVEPTHLDFRISRFISVCISERIIKIGLCRPMFNNARLSTERKRHHPFMSAHNEVYCRCLRCRRLCVSNCPLGRSIWSKEGPVVSIDADNITDDRRHQSGQTRRPCVRVYNLPVGRLWPPSNKSSASDRRLDGPHTNSWKPVARFYSH